MDGPPLAGAQVCPPAPLRYSHLKNAGLLEKRRCPGCRFFEWRGCQGPLGWLARPAAEGEDTGHPSGRSEPLTRSERLTLPALPGDVGQRPLSISRHMPSGERCFCWKQHQGEAVENTYYQVASAFFQNASSARAAVDNGMPLSTGERAVPKARRLSLVKE